MATRYTPCTMVLLLLITMGISITTDCRITVDINMRATGQCSFLTNGIYEFKVKIPNAKDISAHSQNRTIPYIMNNSEIYILSGGSPYILFDFIIGELPRFNTTTSILNISLPENGNNYLEVTPPKGCFIINNPGSPWTDVLEVGDNRKYVWQNGGDLSIYIYCPETYNKKSLLSVIVLYVFLFGIAFLLTVIFLSLLNYKKPTKLDIILDTLPPEEKRVLDFIVRSGGEAYQKDISESLDMDKYETSKIIKMLVDRKLVIKERRGRKNIIKVDPWLLS